jgi:mitochondrial fission protein ELM1
MRYCSNWKSLRASLPEPARLMIANSRRTPEALGKVLFERYGQRFQSWDACPQGWLVDTLAVTDSVWVTEDSVSMVYEALTAGLPCRLAHVADPSAREPGHAWRGTVGG